MRKEFPEYLLKKLLKAICNSLAKDSFLTISRRKSRRYFPVEFFMKLLKKSAESILKEIFDKSSKGITREVNRKSCQKNTKKLTGTFDN